MSSPGKKRKIGPPGSAKPKPMYVADPIWPTLSHIAYRPEPVTASGCVASPYPYKVARLPPVRPASLPDYRMFKGPKRQKGGPNASD